MFLLGVANGKIQDSEILVKNLNPRLLDFETRKKVKQTMQKLDFEIYQKRFQDFEILPKFSETHIFEVPFATPSVIKYTLLNMVIFCSILSSHIHVKEYGMLII